MIIAYGSLCIFLDEKERKTFLDKYKDKPCVLVEERDHSGKATSIIADNYHGMYAVAEHLVRNHGYRRFTYLAGPHGNTDANERRQAVFDVMNAYKVSFDESRVAYGDFSSCVQQQVNQLLDENADKRAIENLLLRKRQIHDKILSHIIKREKEKFSTFQQESWFVPLISRDMLCHMDDEREFYRRSLVKLQALGAEASYFYIFEHPTAHFRNEEWHCPKRMYLTAYQSGEDIIAYEEDKRPEVVTTFAGEGKITRRKNHAQNYVATIFCLFSGEIQYGILVAEIDPAYLSLFYLISRQIGNMLRMYQMSEEQKTMQRKLEILVREIQEKNEVLNFISESDALTGCMNRRGFIEKTLQMNRDHEGEELLILFADLDHLKEINDSFGHIEGDFSIRHCAEVLKKVVGADGIVGRIGGDEFCVVTLGNLKDGQQIIERIREESDAFNCTSDKEYYVELSAGCTSVICRNGLVIADALREADRALYEVKKLRRNSVKKNPVMKTYPVQVLFLNYLCLTKLSVPLYPDVLYGFPFPIVTSVDLSFK